MAPAVVSPSAAYCLAAKPNSPHNAAFATVVDYSFFDRGEYFELTVGVNQVTLLRYDRATRDEIAASIQESVRTLLFPGTQQDFLEVSL